MLSLGRNIKQPNDPLEKISIQQLADKIRKPSLPFIDFIVQLRQVQGIDAKKYRELKTKLPYVVGAAFNPPFRKIEYFAHTTYFILDIDHLAEREIDTEVLSNRLKQDQRVVMLFKSPSGDGLKVMFKLSEPLYDHGKYTLFYKVFARQFGLEYNIDQVIDKRTSDVSRACFVSYDPDIYLNLTPLEINVAGMINFENELELREINQIIKEEEKQNKSVEPSKEDGQDMPDDLIKQIRERLNPRLVEKREKKIYVPEQLNTIVQLVENNLATYGIQVTEIVNIHYGKQFRLKLNQTAAEVNVFYGKRGYTIVKSTKSGCSTELTDLAHDIFQSIIP